MSSLAEIVELFETKERLDPCALTSSQVPQVRGLYAWFWKRAKAPDYIGKATGEKGLRRRICGQHLNPSYLETRQARWTHEDRAQASCGV